MASTTRRVRFGLYELDLDTLELWKASEPVPLTLQPSKALALLVDNAGSLVTRERFHRHLWPDSTVEVDQGLNTCIRQLRTALGDDADEPTFIETVPRRGYRFVHPVQARDATELSTQRRRALGRTAILVAGGLAAAAWILWRSATPSPPVRLAVLPFQPIGADDDTTLRRRPQ